ncbi:Forkhead-associated domain-containing protein 1, partial [Opisthocomus hoazin]
TRGRHEGSDVVLQSTGVAEHHAALAFAAWDNSFVLQDFNSPHGTFVNGCQVQNAAVKVSPGDILRFGVGGASFELVVDGAAPVKMSCPPVKRHTAWTGQLQPESARVRSVATAISPDAFGRTSAVRPDRPSLGQCRERKTLPRPAGHTCPNASQDPIGFLGSQGTLLAHGQPVVHQDTQVPLHRAALQQGEKQKASGRLSASETEFKQKDAMIRDLQDEIAAMAKTLAQAAARNEVELTQKLLTFDRELAAKTEEIKALREQISHLQKGSSQVFSHSLYERDLEIGRLRKEGEKLKRDHALAAGLVTSLQREIAGKEHKIQQLKEDVEKTKKENREKDNQLAVVSAKCSRIREELKRELGEREVTACRNRIGELERELEELQGQVRKHRAEQESIRTQLAEKAKVRAWLR